jgi:hypothetical protein
MGWRVTAAFVTATTQVDGGRAAVDILRGAVLPGDVPVEEMQRFLDAGAVEPDGAGSPEPLAAAADPDGDVPDGTVAAVLSWVGDDTDRARSALDAESAKGDRARKTLVDALTALTG